MAAGGTLALAHATHSLCAQRRLSSSYEQVDGELCAQPGSTIGDLSSGARGGQLPVPRGQSSMRSHPNLMGPVLLLPVLRRPSASKPAADNSPASAAGPSALEGRPAPRPPRQVCAAEGCSITRGLRKCPDCRVVRYCSRDCQEKHWDDCHWQECKRLRRIAQRAAAAAAAAATAAPAPS